MRNGGRMMAGAKMIPMPDYFNLEWYVEQKELNIPDKQIAQSLFISHGTLQNWKLRIGWSLGDGWKYIGRRVTIPTKQIKDLRKEGYSYRKIADILEISESSVKRHLKMEDE